MNLTERIRRLCIEHGDTLASLERKLDFGNGTIRRWEKTYPSGDKLSKVADYFNVSVDFLLGRTTEIKAEQLDSVYFSFAKDAQDNGIDPEDIRMVIELLKKNRK